MLFRWKKVMRTRVSQLVSDHLHKSQKRRGDSSLVVETGFPTSLIDLFIKNRDKLSRKTRDVFSQSCDDDPIIPGSPTPFHSPPQSPVSTESSTLSDSSSAFSLPVRSDETIILDGCIGLVEGENKCDADQGVNAKGVISLVVKICFLVVLTLTTKRLTLGITIFAFFLFFLDFVVRNLKSCLKAEEWSRCTLKWSRDKEEIGGVLPLKAQREQFLQPKCYSPIISAQEVEISTAYTAGEIQSDKEVTDDLCSVGRNKLEDFLGAKQCVGEVAEWKRTSRKHKLKSRMKRFVPKKLQSARKEHTLGKLTNSALCEGHVLTDGRESECSGRLSSISSVDFIDVDVCDKEAVVKKETESRLSRRHFLICLTILIGLIGGRAIALILTLLWFLVLKLGKTLQTVNWAGFQF